MKLRIKSNFSFSKLAKAMPGILEKHSTGAGAGAVKSIKNAIKTGKFEKLRDSTKDIRKRGRSPSAGFMKTNSKKPLIHTGRLLNSIRVEKDGIKMNSYGEFQNDGYITKRTSMIGGAYKVPPRPFIDKGMALATKTPEGKKANEELAKSMRRALRK